MLDLSERAAIAAVEGSDEAAWADFGGRLPAELATHLARFPKHLQRRALRGQRAAALLVGRPLAAYRKLVPLGAAGSALRPEAERMAAGEGWELRESGKHAHDGPTPYYRQSTGFTCGPASLAMALSALAGWPNPNRKLELQIWREATTIHATNGPGGCDPFGLALAAERRGLKATVVKSHPGPQLDRVPDEVRRELIHFVQDSFRQEVEAGGIETAYRPVDAALLRAHIAGGGQAILLVDQIHMHAEVCPHWVLLTAFREGFFRAHDPWLDDAQGECEADVVDLPLSPAAVETIGRYGDPPYQSAVLLSRR